MHFNWLSSLDFKLTATAVVLILPGTLALVIAVALIARSRYLANNGVPFVAGKSPLSVLYQHCRFVVNGPALIQAGYDRFSDGLFEIPRAFHFGQVILCKPELIEELQNTRSVVASPEPWIDQLLQISHLMPGYFPRGGGWPAIAKTTSGLIRGTAHKQLDRYIPHITESILSQLGALNLDRDGGKFQTPFKATGRVGRKPANIYFKECAIGCFDFAHSIVAQSGSFAMVGSRLSQNEEYIQAVKDHILRMIMTTRV
ncbi:uncharacterized protein N7473_007511 [Penicillium subrubescens]|uniref:uncharacterized protein n=1 Tax=Penicillium subrubescens TaxID=1316194 RepID=UPI002545B250|nr:uncharacterized protein N7473_007511 [Penicillium subrubescens]KAJ5891283.1 hypothetical protein N7473_007511 [Penicillium subrubescens]